MLGGAPDGNYNKKHGGVGVLLAPQTSLARIAVSLVLGPSVSHFQRQAWGVIVLSKRTPYICTYVARNSNYNPITQHPRRLPTRPWSVAALAVANRPVKSM